MRATSAGKANFADLAVVNRPDIGSERSIKGKSEYVIFFLVSSTVQAA